MQTKNSRIKFRMTLLESQLSLKRQYFHLNLTSIATVFHDTRITTERTTTVVGGTAFLHDTLLAHQFISPKVDLQKKSIFFTSLSQVSKNF